MYELSIQGSEDTVHRQLRFLFRREIEWIAETIKRDEEEQVAAIKAAEEAAEEAGIPHVPEPVVEICRDRKMLKRLKILMVYHSIKTVSSFQKPDNNNHAGASSLEM